MLVEAEHILNTSMTIWEHLIALIPSFEEFLLPFQLFELDTLVGTLVTDIAFAARTLAGDQRSDAWQSYGRFLADGLHSTLARCSLSFAASGNHPRQCACI